MMRALKLLTLPFRTIHKLRLKRRNLDFEAPSEVIEASPDHIDDKAALAAPRKSEKSKVKSTTKKQTPPPPPLEECPICQDPVSIPSPEGITEAWTKLHCGHRFGTVCIQKWLQESIERDPNTNPTCPICRTMAKHPGCGHLICPQDFESQHLQYQMRMQWHNLHARNNANSRRPRRRLQRRDGHPLRPPPPTKRTAGTVGDCTTCVENAAYEAKMKKIVEQAQANVHAHHTAEAERDRRASGGIKSILPLLIRTRSSGTTLRGPSSPITPIAEDGDEDERRGRVQTMYCAGSEITGAPRSSTPAPFAGGRRGSV